MSDVPQFSEELVSANTQPAIAMDAAAEHPEQMELVNLGIRCDVMATFEVLEEIHQIIELLQPLAKDQFEINLSAIVDVLATKTEITDWSLLVKKPVDMYRKLLSDLSKIRKGESTNFDYLEHQTIFEIYHRLSEQANDRIAVCIEMLSNRIDSLHQPQKQFAVDDVNKLTESLSAAVMS